MRQPLLSVLAATLALSCQKPPREASAPPETVFEHPGLGVSFAVPSDWVRQNEGSAIVFSGPEGSPAFYTTLTLQTSPEGAAADPDDTMLLERVLEHSYSALESDRTPRFVGRSPARVAGVEALRYFVSFDLHERDRLRAGVLLRVRSSIVDVSYTAPAERFGDNLHVFERALATLRIDPGDGGAP